MSACVLKNAIGIRQPLFPRPQRRRGRPCACLASSCLKDPQAGLLGSITLITRRIRSQQIRQHYLNASQG